MKGAQRIENAVKTCIAALEASQDFNIQSFNEGDYFRAIEDKIESEKISKILYPSDTYISGKELRLLQEYFLVACSVRDIFRRYLELGSMRLSHASRQYG